MVEDRKSEVANEENVDPVSGEAAVDVSALQSGSREPEAVSGQAESLPDPASQQASNPSREDGSEGAGSGGSAADEERSAVAEEPERDSQEVAEDPGPASGGDAAVDEERVVVDEEADDAPPAEPLELIEDSEEEGDSEATKQWYILKVQVNREKSICDALIRRVKIAGLDDYFGEILIPTEDVREFTKTGKQRIVKRKLYPGYILVNMAINDDTWFLVRETPGIGDFTGAAGKPTPMESFEVERILKTMKPDEEEASPEKTNIRFKHGDRVRVKEGYFQNFEGEVESIDEANGRITVMINIFGRPTPVELDHWQFEDV